MYRQILEKSNPTIEFKHEVFNKNDDIDEYDLCDNDIPNISYWTFNTKLPNLTTWTNDIYTIVVKVVRPYIDTFECHGDKCRNTFDCTFDAWCLSCHFDPHKESSLKDIYDKVDRFPKKYSDLRDFDIISIDKSSTIKLTSEDLKQYNKLLNESIKDRNEEIVSLKERMKNIQAKLDKLENIKDYDLLGFTSEEQLDQFKLLHDKFLS